MTRIEGFEFPDELFYDAPEHLWLRPAREGPTVRVTVGIDAGGKDALGEAVYVQLGEPGRAVARGEAVGSVEAEKMVRPLLAPVSGTLVEVNRAVIASPRLINDDPYGEGWLFRIEAPKWEDDRLRLLYGHEAVRAWVRGELEAHGRA